MHSSLEDGKSFNSCLSKSDQIAQMAINFSCIKDVPEDCLFYVLNHPKCRFPSQKDFIEQVIDFFSNEEKVTMEYIKLFSFIDFSLASLDQLRKLSKIDVECYHKCFPDDFEQPQQKPKTEMVFLYEDLNRFLIIRESEDNFNKRSHFLQSQKQKYVINMMDFMILQKQYNDFQDETILKNQEIDQLQEEIDEMQSESKRMDDELESLNVSLGDILKRHDLTQENPEDKLNQLINDHMDEIEKCDKEISTIKSKIGEQDEYLKKIKRIEDIKTKYKEVCKSQDALKERYDKAKQSYDKIKSSYK
ncbi:hypothetical protein M9Y10_005605 [Tritrichomonas musculus]|uniref:Uncharacterized protein n=1 Tax=Tritrichomonas musculus TaxID=1915356 RepID=A0ABR2JEU1_9EUKA